MTAKVITLAVGWLLGGSLVPTVSHAQSASVQPRPAPTSSAAAASGRFQLVPLPQGTMFLVDSATGRAWRYTQVTPSDSTVQTYVTTQIALREAASGRAFSEAEKKALADEIKKTAKEEIDAMSNPCKGLVACFVETDRVRLTPTGGWASEIVK